jgi:hypothetical protein
LRLGEACRWHVALHRGGPDIVLKDHDERSVSGRRRESIRLVGNPQVHQFAARQRLKLSVLDGPAGGKATPIVRIAARRQQQRQKRVSACAGFVHEPRHVVVA